MRVLSLESWGLGLGAWGLGLGAWGLSIVLAGWFECVDLCLCSLIQNRI